MGLRLVFMQVLEKVIGVCIVRIVLEVTVTTLQPIIKQLL